MAHSHDQHQHAPQRFDRAFALGIGLNLAYVLIEAFYGWQVNSLALLADAGHNLGDVGGLVLAWAAIAAARLRSNDRHTYGWRRASMDRTWRRRPLTPHRACAWNTSAPRMRAAMWQFCMIFPCTSARASAWP